MSTGRGKKNLGGMMMMMREWVLLMRREREKGQCRRRELGPSRSVGETSTSTRYFGVVLGRRPGIEGVIVKRVAWGE